MTKPFQSNKDLNALAREFNTKIDTADIKFTGYGRSAISNEGEIVGLLFTLKKNQVTGPLTGNYGVYFVDVLEMTEPSAKEDFTSEKMKLQSAFDSRVANSTYEAIEKVVKIQDNRAKFF
jgi:peptidyl-prolyl cis-trans isomerase D